MISCLPKRETSPSTWRRPTDARQLKGMESETVGAANASIHKVKLQGARCKGKKKN